MKKYIFFLLLAVSCIIIIYILYPTDEKQIRKIISTSEKAIISENIDKLMESISYNYSDDYGYSYLFIKQQMQAVFERLNNIEIEKNIINISVKENHAEAEMSVRVVTSEGENRGYIAGSAEKPETIKVFFEKSSHKWLITKVEGRFN